MTEREWLAGTDLTVMLECLRNNASRRKFGLWAVACYRAFLWPGHKFAQAVDVVERYVEGEGSEVELETMYRTYHTSLIIIRPPNDPCDFASLQVGLFTRKLKGLPAALLRNIIGPLLFRPASIDPAWLAWNNAAVKHIAAGIYEERAFDRLPILADALEKAGCDNADILTHLRSPGPHVRGCWPVDLILGKS
jgi:hypothetical protein